MDTDEFSTGFCGGILTCAVLGMILLAILSIGTQTIKEETLHKLCKEKYGKDAWFNQIKHSNHTLFNNADQTINCVIYQKQEKNITTSPPIQLEIKPTE